MLPTIDWQGDTIVMVDQRKLPAQEIYVKCKSAVEVARAIRTMVIRGAPAIGVATAMGIALGMQRSTAKGTRQFAVEFQKICELMAGDPADGGQPVLGHRPDEAGVRRRGAGRALDRRDRRAPGAAKPAASTTRTSRPASGWAASAPRWCRTARAC